MSTDTDRDLLFGLIALQVGLIDQAQLVAAFQAWARDKARPLADHLADRGGLGADGRAAVGAMVALHIKKHGGDAEKSLASIPAGHSTRERLAALGDASLTGTVAHLGPAPTEADADRTASYSVGTATSDGQRFRVLRPHAQGGLGAVFVALDGELHREVALKQILDAHADDPTSRQRFLVEAEITGGLEHPGIVPVYGLGTYAGGRPFYAMRFIRGDSLRDAIAAFHQHHRLGRDTGARSLALRNLLRRFTDVCNAVGYAHGRGILHRDLKPGNVILGKHGETLVVDWGLAKSVGATDPGSASDERTLVPSSASRSAETLPGSALGTPAYMSPEQARGDLEHLGPRSDVYSLGATLYCVLTGKPPFEGEDLGAILRAVQEGAFPPPRGLDPTIDPALEAVCLTAMESEPGDRYDSCRDLADDVERWAADEPVTAWREPPSRRLRRWARRNRMAVTGAAAAVLVALVGTAAVLAVQTRANDQLKQANAALFASYEREAARFELAQDAVRLFHGEISEDLLLKEGKFKALRTKLLRGAADFYGKLEAMLKAKEDRISRAALAKAYDELGGLTAKIGDKGEALAVHRKALAVRRTLASGPGAEAEATLDVARSQLAIALLNLDTGDMSGALTACAEAQSLTEGLTASRTGSDAALEVLGKCLQLAGLAFSMTGKPSEAMTWFEKARVIRQALADANSHVTGLQNDLAESQYSIGIVLWRTGKPSEALASFEKARAVRQALADADPHVANFQKDLASCQSNIGWILLDRGKTSEALAWFEKSRAIRQALVDAYPAVSVFQDDLAKCQYSIAYLLTGTGRPSEALKWYEKSRVIRRALADANPDVPGLQSAVAFCQFQIGWVLWRTGRPSEALSATSCGQKIFQQLVDAHPDLLAIRDGLAMTHSHTAELLRASGRIDEARASCKRAVALYETLIKADPETRAYRVGLAVSLLRSGQVRRSAGDSSGAASDWRRAVAMYKRLPIGERGEACLEASCHAMLSSLAGEAGSGVSAADGPSESALAMAVLRRAVAFGFRDADRLRIEAALDPLRSYADFQFLIMDLEMPVDPFATPR